MTPEKLNIWDRLFHRYRKEVIEEGSERWTKRYYPYMEDAYNYQRDYVKYRVIDRLTGSVEIKKEYLN